MPHRLTQSYLLQLMVGPPKVHQKQEEHKESSASSTSRWHKTHNIPRARHCEQFARQKGMDHEPQRKELRLHIA